MSEDDLNPSATGLTAKEVLLEVRTDVKQISRDVAILTSQNLDQRVNAIESWQDRVNGRISLLTAGVLFLGGLLGLALTVVTLLRVVLPPAV